MPSIGLLLIGMPGLSTRLSAGYPESQSVSSNTSFRLQGYKLYKTKIEVLFMDYYYYY